MAKDDDPQMFVCGVKLAVKYIVTSKHLWLMPILCVKYEWERKKFGIDPILTQ